MCRILEQPYYSKDFTNRHISTITFRKFVRNGYEFLIWFSGQCFTFFASSFVIALFVLLLQLHQRYLYDHSCRQLTKNLFSTLKNRKLKQSSHCCLWIVLSKSKSSKLIAIIKWEHSIGNVPTAKLFWIWGLK